MSFVIDTFSNAVTCQISHSGNLVATQACIIVFLEWYSIILCAQHLRMILINGHLNPTCNYMYIVDLKYSRSTIYVNVISGRTRECTWGFPLRLAPLAKFFAKLDLAMLTLVRFLKSSI